MDASLYIDHVKINPKVLLSHQSILERQNALFSYKRCEVRNFTIPPKVSSFSLDNICNDPLPELIMFAFVKTSAYNGKRSLNPYNFQHFNITSCSLSRDGIEVAPRNLNFNYSLINREMSSHGYFALFRQLNMHRYDKATSITRKL